MLRFSPKHTGELIAGVLIMLLGATVLWLARRPQPFPTLLKTWWLREDTDQTDARDNPKNRAYAALWSLLVLGMGLFAVVQALTL